MNAINFVVRSPVGTIERGVIGADDRGFLIDASGGREVSLNLHRSDMRGYDRAGNDLMISLADGRVIVLENYFGSDQEGRLLLSTDGVLSEVVFAEADGGVLFAQYGEVAAWGKWSPDDALIFFERAEVVAADVVAAESEGGVSMLAAGLLAGGGLLPWLGAGAAAATGVAVIGGGDGDNGGGDGGLVGSDGDGGGPNAPTVNDGSYTIGGDDVTDADRVVTVTGTANPGDTVQVTVGDNTQTTTTGGDGNWEVEFSGPNFPPDGTYTAVVVVVGETETTLTGPSVVIDTTPPPVAITSGTTSTGEIISDSEFDGGATVTGTTEIGATVVLIAGGVSHVCDVDAQGNWSVTLGSSTFERGEYISDITIIATDSFGNSTTIVDGIQIDTVSNVSLNTTTIETDGIINADERSDGVEVTGTTDPGSTVMVEMNGFTRQATVSANGSWSVTFIATEIPVGEQSVTITATGTDAVGNTSIATGQVLVDTISNVSVNTATIETDGIINAAERSDGVEVTGTTDPGSTVMVEMNGFTRQAVVSANGSWSVTFIATEIPEGVQTVTINATATDAAGNSSTASGQVQVDTLSSVSVNTAIVETDGVINAAERSDGVEVTGTTDPGSTVMVEMNGFTRPAVVSANGTWSVTFAAGEVPVGERAVTINATATDAVGNTSSASGQVQVDTFVRNFAITSQEGGADGVVNAAEAAQGVTVTGTTEPGATVSISLAGVSRPGTVDANGNWTATFLSSELPSGEQTVTLTAHSTDAAGNTTSQSRSVVFDTDAGILTISPAPVETDDIINAAEASDGVTLTGTSTPFQSVTVTMDGVNKSVTTDANGIWRATYLAGEIRPGEYEAQITAHIVDSAGNELTRTDSVMVDTFVRNFQVSANPVTADNVVNNAEKAQGVTLSGTTEPGATVSVTVEGVARTANVDAAGNWTVTFSSLQIPSGTYSTTAQISTQDAAGNTATTSKTFVVDTEVTPLTSTSAPGGTDGVVSEAEAAQGFQLTGQVEQGSSVTVTIGGTAMAAQVTGGGMWSVNVPSSVIPMVNGQNVAINISATDAAGNTRTITQQMTVDNVAPDSPDMTSITRDDSQSVRGITLDASDNDVSIGRVTASGSVQNVGFSEVDIPALGETQFVFNQVVPDGSHLVVSATDSAGNRSGIYVVVDDPDTNQSNVTVANNLSQYEIKAIDLEFTDQATLTITEAQIVALANQTNDVKVFGNSDDAVQITGATRTGRVTEDGTSFNVYEMGDANILIDEDITQVSTI
jgi:large repetitive protein